MPFPLIGAAALRADAPWEADAWIPVFLDAIAGEAEDGLQLLTTLERAWFAARRAAAGRRRTSRAALAIDVLAAAPLVSATSLGRALGMAAKNAALLLERFRAAAIAVEVTHRSRRRLFGLADLAPLRDGVAPPRRPEPGRGRGRPPILPIEDKIAEPLPLPPLTPLERGEFDYSDLNHWMVQMDQAIRRTRRVLGDMARPMMPGSATNQPLGDDHAPSGYADAEAMQ